MRVLRFYFSPFGRVSRKGLWLGFVLPYFLLSAVLLMVFTLSFSNGRDSDLAAIGGFFEKWLVVILPVWWASIVISIKRLHDRNISAFWLLPMVLWAGVGNGLMILNLEIFHIVQSLIFVLGLIVMLINLWLGINIYFLRGTKGPNRFGPDPLERS